MDYEINLFPKLYFQIQNPMLYISRFTLILPNRYENVDASGTGEWLRVG